MVSALYSRSCPQSRAATGARPWPPHVTGLFGGSGAHVPKVMRFTCSRGWSLVGPRKRGHRVGPTRLLHPIEVSQSMTPGAPSVELQKVLGNHPFVGGSS